MNKRAVGWLLGRVVLLLAVFQLVPALVAAWYRERAVLEGCLYSAGTCALLGALLSLAFRGSSLTREGRPDYFRREGLAAVGLAWLTACVLGALPFLFSGAMGSVVDALFESTSGFTTTGSSILTGAEIDALPRGLHFWRAFSHWLGGIGIIIVFVLLFPAGGRSLFRSEVSGISREAARARVRDSAFGLLRIYVFLTVVHAALLYAVHADLYDCVIHAFSTLATGGFSSHGSSVAFFASWKVELVIVLFMCLAGVNFDVYDTVQRQGLVAGWRAFTRSSEVRAFFGLVLGSALVLGVTLWFWGGSNGAPDSALPDYTRLSRCLRDALFTVTSLQTCTGYATANFDLWPDACRLWLVVLTAVGACAGSTGGGLKVVRLVILWKATRQGITRFARPRAVEPVRMDGASLEDGTVQGVLAYIGLWLIVVALSTVGIVATGFQSPHGFGDQHILSAFTAVVASLSNCGPGLAAVGPYEYYGFLPAVSKLLLSFLMLLGRLEFAAMVVLLMPRFWRA
ncbi:MAG TPA: TrkH family potassium uptake protein [Planctomycetota bacterium]